MEEKPMILYIEDNVMNRTLVKRVLEHRGFRVLEADDGPAGIVVAREMKPDLILMDLNIPGTDGYETTRRIKSDSELCSIPVIALTAYAMRGDREKALAAGCDGHITKPIDVSTFPAKIEEFLRQARAQATTAPAGPAQN